MVKRLLFKMLTLAAVLATLQANAAMYIVGDMPFGGWSLSDPVQMTDNGNGTYSYSNIINGTVYFVFGDGLADDWTTFGENYRYGPTELDGNGNQEVDANTWIATQRSDFGVFIFTGDGSNYTITFDKNEMTFMIKGALYSFEEDGIYYKITDYNTVSVAKGSTYGNDYHGDITIPSSVTHDGVTYQVTAIGRDAFQSCHELTSIDIPTSVRRIGESAFYYCTSLTQVVIPESVETIDDWNFYRSEELTTVILPSTLQSMGHDCFGSCPKISQVTCKAITPPTLGQYCFNAVYPTPPRLHVLAGSVSAYQTNNQWNIFFNPITAMPDYDFSEINLKFVITGGHSAKVVGCVLNPTVAEGTWNVPDQVTYNGVSYKITEIGIRAFSGYEKIKTFILGANVKVIGPYAFFDCRELSGLILKNVEIIAGAAFSNTPSLKAVTFPNTLTCINEYAFDNSGLTYVYIPASVQIIGSNPFHDCQSLTEIEVDSSNPNYTSVNGVLFNKSMTELIGYPVGNNANSYIVPEGVTQIGINAFGYAKKLRNVTLPSSLTYVNYIAFAYSPSLVNVTCLAQTPPSVFENPFISTIGNNGLTLIVPEGRKSAYQAADVWKDFPLIVEKNYDFMVDDIYYNITGNNTVEVTKGPNNVVAYSGEVNIPERVFYNGVNYTVTAIGDKAFEGCAYMTAINLPSTITTIGYMAFYYCTGLTSIILPENLTTIGIYAFYYCSDLGNVKIPSSVTSLETYAFCGCSSFTEVVIPSSVRSMGYGTFYDCSSLTKVTLGSSLTNIGADAFKNCAALETIIIHASTPPTISSNTFMDYHYSNVHLMVPKNSLSVYKSADYWKNFTNITSMAYDFEKDGVFYNILNSSAVEVTYMTSDYNSYSGEVNIPETVEHNGVTYTVTAIGNNAFKESRSMTAVTIPNTVTMIKDYAFHYCVGLTHVDIPNSVITIGNNAFWLCMGLEEAIIPNSVTTIGTMAFRNCTAMKRVVIGKNVTSIGGTCFLYNPNITEVICLAATPPTLNDPTSGTMTTFQTAVYTNAVLRVPYGSHEAYRNDANWGKFVNIVSEQNVDGGIPGDVNGDGSTTIKDVTDLINFLLTGSAPSLDVNGDNLVNIKDVTDLINMLLTGEGGLTPVITSTNFLINSVPFSMINVEGGTFMMGLEGDASASPVHEVTLSDYFIGETEVTQALWQTVMGSNPSSNKSDEWLPVENMDWHACQQFTTRLSQLTGRNFRLPTEAEWEFAARGGNKSQGYTYAGSDNLAEVAWYAANSGNSTHVVATKKANELGLYDMSGNVFEWCQDYWDDYPSEAQVNPQGPSSGEYKSCRSSAYNRNNNNNWFKCGGRTYDTPTNNAYDTGLRVVCDSSQE